MPGNSQDGPGDRKLNEGDRSGKDVNLAASPRLSRAGAPRHAGDHSRRECGEQGVGKSQALEGPCEAREGEENPSEKPRAVRSWKNQELGTQEAKRPHTVKCKPGLHNARTSEMMPGNSVTPFASEFTVKCKFQILTLKIVYSYRIMR